MKLHAIAGMPRAGSTLFCNILNQRPDTYATSTSFLPGIVRAMGSHAAARLEFKNLLNRDLAGAQKRYRDSVRAYCDAWHGVHGKDVVFDKSRQWNSSARAFRDISPDGKIVLCVRDLRGIFASVEIEEAKNGLITEAPASLFNRYRYHFSADGVIGGPYQAIMDLIDTKPDNLAVVHYERLLSDPGQVMQEIEDFLGLPHYEHDFNDIPDTAIDCDGFYLGKFPHRASGKLEYRDEHWSDVIPPGIAADIMRSGEKYNRHFGYEVAAAPTQPAAAGEPAPAETPAEPGDVSDKELEVANYV